jgi:hypothetical protein
VVILAPPSSRHRGPGGHGPAEDAGRESYRGYIAVTDAGSTV